MEWLGGKPRAVVLGCPSGANPAPFPGWRSQIFSYFLALPLLPSPALTLFPLGSTLGLGLLRPWSVGAAWGGKEFSRCHINPGVIQTSCSVWVGLSCSLLPNRGAAPQKNPPEPHPHIQPFPSLLLGGAWLLSQPLRVAQRSSLAGVKGAGGDRAATAEPLLAGGAA